MDYNKLSAEIFNSPANNLAKLAALFPVAVKDGQLDIAALREELGQFEEVGAEKYELTWAGKTEAKKLAQTDVLGRTLKYIPKDSKNPDTTENLYIEGDNLEVLKLLRQNYYGAIKMIYIDPPYNTGNDFVYRDNFAMDSAESDEAEGEMQDGERLVVNQKSSNRYHANWLSMMYPRLKIAKDLLRENGIIFISIDDNEVDNLKKLCNEVFGEENCLGTIVRSTGQTTGQDSGGLGASFDYLLVYANNPEISLLGLPLTQDDLKRFENEDEVGKYAYDQMRKTGSNDRRQDRPNMFYAILDPDGNDVLPIGPTGYESCWRFERKTYDSLVEKGFILWKKTKKGGNEVWWPYVKYYLEGRTKRPSPLWTDLEGNKKASRDVRSIFEGVKVFDYAKPIELLVRALMICSQETNDIILDFFSGSATTAHAVMQLNAEDGGNRKFIMVQVPELTDEKSEAYKSGYKNICEIGKERIRRAGEKIKKEIDESNVQLKLGEEPKQVPDIGFKVFRTADTNIRWTHDELKGGQIDIDESRLSEKDKLDFMPHYTDIDVVYEVLLRQRDIPLSATIEKLPHIGDRTYLIANQYAVCLEEIITTDMVEQLAAIEPLPDKFILRDSAFEDNISLKDETIRRLQALIARNTGEKKRTYTVEFI